MSTVAAASASARKDARPIIPRNATNLWSRAENVRDELYGVFGSVCQRHGIDALVLQSGPFVFPAWVRFEAWKPQDDPLKTERSSAIVTIEPKPFHKFPFEFTVTYTTQNQTRTVRRVASMADAEVEGLIAHLVERGPRPRLERFQDTILQFWRVRNKLEGLRRDALATWMILLIAAGFFTLAIVVGFFLWIGAAIIYMRMRKRRWLVRVDGKPDGEPRSLIRVDSWQTVLFDLGPERAMVLDRFMRALEDGLSDQCTYWPEHVWYWGLDGKEERQQIVLTSGRGMVFCQIYQYGRDLYIGWDGHLNRGQWVEQTVASGIDRDSGNPVHVSRVVPGTQPTTEYDLADLSCLMEWTHAQMTRLLKQLSAEKRIDQEIDFAIQRAERREVVASGASRETGATSRIRRVFQRTA